MEIPPTYTFQEAIDLIKDADNIHELHIIADVLMDDKKKYPLFYLHVLAEALRIKREQIQSAVKK